MSHCRMWARVAVLVVAIVSLQSCSEQKSPLDAEGGGLHGTDFLEDEPHSFEALARNDLSDPLSRQIVRAYATDILPSLPQQPLPVLYLLHDFVGPNAIGTGSDYFERYNLQQMLLDMYENGEIGRMMVVTVDATNAFGGSFYRNASTLGRYEDVLDDLIAHVESSSRVYTAGGTAARAISGHGMGGYGAMRYVLDHPDKFGSVSSMSGPLSFGTTQSDFGILSDGGIVDQVFAENGIVVPDPSGSVYSQIRLNRLMPTTSLYMAMCSAFSPYPLRKFDSTGCLIYPIPGSIRKDTVCPWDFYSGIVPTPHTLAFDDIGLDTLGVGLNMLFDNTGMLDEYSRDSVWALWRDSADVKTVFLRKRVENPALFSNVNIMFDCGVDNEYGYYEMNEDFHKTLDALGVDHQFVSYEGVAGIPADHASLIQWRLREIIKFHDKLFARPPSPPGL